MIQNIAQYIGNLHEVASRNLLVYEIRGYIVGEKEDDLRKCDVQTADVENVHVVGDTRGDGDELEGVCIKIVGQ